MRPGQIITGAYSLVALSATATVFLALTSACSAAACLAAFLCRQDPKLVSGVTFPDLGSYGWCMMLCTEDRL